jgi:hypothetical protein
MLQGSEPVEVPVMTKKRLILLVMVAMLIVVCAKKAKMSRASEWHGLTESEVRSKLDAKLPGRIPDEKRSEISDKVVAKMRDRGVLGEDATEADQADEPAEMADA